MRLTLVEEITEWLEEHGAPRAIIQRLRVTFEEHPDNLLGKKVDSLFLLLTPEVLAQSGVLPPVVMSSFVDLFANHVSQGPDPVETFSFWKALRSLSADERVRDAFRHASWPSSFTEARDRWQEGRRIWQIGWPIVRQKFGWGFLARKE